MKNLKNQKGQGLVEYLILVAMMGVAAIAIVRTLGQTINAQFTNITYALQGEQQKVKPNKVQDSMYKKRDLGDFMNGAAKDNKDNQE